VRWIKQKSYVSALLIWFLLKIRKALPLLVCVCALSIISASAASGATINFDDLNATAGDIVLANLNPYQGFNWMNFSVYTSTPGFPGFNNGIISAPNAAYTTGDVLGSPIVSTITATGDFDFVGASVGSGWYDGLSVTVNGLLNGTQAFSRTVMVNTQGAKLFTFNFDDINEVDIFSTITASTTDPYGCGPAGCSQVTLDNLTFTPSSGPPPVPEPATLPLSVLGVLALAGLRRRNK
jgi:hypothetical protein